MIVTVFPLRVYRQPDGVLQVVDRSDLPEGHPPFARVFTIRDVPSDQFRGGHAHRQCHQTFVILRGSLTLHVATPSGEHYEQRLEAARPMGVWVPPWRWCTLTDWRDRAILMVLASHYYDPADYIEDHDAFLAGVEVGP